MDGLITEIQRFSLHDGPGIRTTVFTKGCNMQCRWCHNPETIRARPELQFFPEKCIACGNCCPSPDADPNDCLTDPDGHLRQYKGNCHAKALVKVGRSVTPQAVVEEVLQDRQYYANSGGGVTLSGGEVTLQAEFSKATLSLCKEHGIHTAIETNLAMPWERIATLLPYLDLILFDIKSMDDALHREWTGVGLERILDNARRLGASDVSLIVRTPVIPGFNDTASTFTAIAEFIAPLPTLQYYELLPFNPLGADKYKCMGKPYLMEDAPMISDAAMHCFHQAASQAGITVRIG